MANRKQQKTGVAVLLKARQLGKVQLSPADKAILGELALNRKAIVKLGQLALDHEDRLQGLEDALSSLSGEDTEPVDLEDEG